MDQGIAAINEQVKRESEFLRTLTGEIIGQRTYPSAVVMRS